MTPEERIEKFWSRMIAQGDGCLVFTGCMDKDGYGKLSVDDKSVLAHRYAWFLTYGSWPKLPVAHKCYNNPCCNPEHLFLRKDMSFQTPEELAKNFWSKVVTQENSCWEFAGCTDNYGYGRLTVPSHKGALAHRYAWFLTHGYWPELCVLHKCDNPPCCNPKHLFLGTKQDNAPDSIKKGRWNAPKGEAHHRAKLSEKDVLQIRKDNRFQRILVVEYGISHTSINNIRQRKTWKHI